MNPSRIEAISKARDWLAKNPYYLDTETTGTDPGSEIVEICILDDNAGVIFDSLVKPTRRIPADATAIHGITNELVYGAQSWAAIWPEVQASLAGKHVGIYNEDFDLRLMKQSHALSFMRFPLQPGFTTFCIMKLYAQYRGEWNSQRRSYRWHSLDAAGRQCNISLPNAHRARADCLLARALLHYIAESKA